MILNMYPRSKSFSVIAQIGEFNRHKHKVIKVLDLQELPHLHHKYPNIDEYQRKQDPHMNLNKITWNNFFETYIGRRTDGSLIRTISNDIVYIPIMFIDDILVQYPDLNIIELAEALHKVYCPQIPATHIAIFLHLYFRQFPDGYWVEGRDIREGYPINVIYKIDPNRFK